VWIFGGEKDGKDLDIAYKYSLKDDVWTSLKVLSVPSRGCSTVVFSNQIYIAGIKHKLIYIFDMVNEVYQYIDNLFLRVGIPKVIFASKSRMLLIDGDGNYYESKFGPSWVQKENKNNFKLPNCSPSSLKCYYAWKEYFVTDCEFYSRQRNIISKL